MEDNHKKLNFNNEFATTFIKKFTYETNNLESSIQNSYNDLMQKFLNLVENRYSHFCKVKRIDSTSISENLPVTNKNIKDSIYNNNYEKLTESFEHVDINDKQKNNSTKPIFRSEQKYQKSYKCHDLSNKIKAKKNLNFTNKVTKNDEIQLKMYPPLASSSILVPREIEKKPISPKANSKNLTDNVYKNVSCSGKVKQIVEMVEARMKETNNQTSSIASKLVKTNSKIQSKDNNGQRLSSKFKKKPGIIEQKKLRNSVSNQEQKRKSIRKINALMKDLHQENSHIKKNLELKNDSEKNVFKVPVQPLNTKALKANLYKNPSTNIDKKPESKAPPVSFSNLYNVKNKEKTNFAKFLERNTPMKISRTELLAKEKREQERLHEREKLLHEKVEIAKKKREEKMKKIADLKHKNEMGIKKRQDEANKPSDSNESKKKANDSEKKSHESEKSKEVLKNIAKLPETVTGIVKNSPFQKLDKQTNNTTTNIKENKKLPNNIDLTPKIKNTTSYNKHDVTKSHLVQVDNQAKVLKHISNLGEKKELTYEDYGIQDLHSSDETDDDEEPSKPIPNWAKDPGLTKMAKNQAYKFINFTKLFKSSAQTNIDLGDIFEKKRKNFYQRSSSANWNTSPIWNTSGIHGNESFMQTHKN